MYFVDTLHKNGIGVILDWVPAHFPKDEHGLYKFDGTRLYEYQGDDRVENEGWGTRYFDVGRNEVQSFLISSALFWLEKYHIDGLRIDAVASMLYLDFDRRPGEWVPNAYGDNKNLEAIAFFRKLNTEVLSRHPDVLMIAEESTSYPHVTGDVREGLGFHLKWNMGWMNDTLFYVEKDPLYRKFHHDKLTFSLMYAFNECFVLPISHDEVVHGKKSFIDKMPGDYWKKFAGARVFAAYQMLHPGKKLTFMGGEIGQFREWAYEGEIEWFLLDEYATHRKHKAFIKALNAFYLAEPALWQVDDSFDGFKWIDADDKDRSVASFRRIDKNGKELIVVLNFTPSTYEDYLLQVPVDGTYVEVFNTDDTAYGGSGVTNAGVQFRSESVGGKQAVRLRLPPLGGCVLRCTRKKTAGRPSRK
jgi:1,4-alpha-glucan branching enzyme